MLHLTAKCCLCSAPDAVAEAAAGRRHPRHAALGGPGACQDGTQAQARGEEGRCTSQVQCLNYN